MRGNFMEQVNFEDVFADLIHSFESAADKIKKLTDELEDEVYMRIANDQKAANGFRPSYPKCKIPKTDMPNKVMQGRIHKHR